MYIIGANIFFFPIEWVCVLWEGEWGGGVRRLKKFGKNCIFIPITNMCKHRNQTNIYESGIRCEFIRT